MGWHQHKTGFEIGLDTNGMHWLLLIGMFIINCFLVLLITSLVKSGRRYLIERKEKRIFMIFCSGATIVMFTLGSINILIGILLVMLSNDFNHYFLVNDIFSKIGFGLYLFSQTVMVFLFVIRIDLTFKGSVIAYSRCVINLLYISWIIFVIFFCFILFLFVMEIWTTLFILTTIWAVLYFLISIILCILFIRKVERLISSSVIDKELLTMVIKHAILIPIAIGSSFVCFVSTLGLEMLLGKTFQMTPIPVFWIVMDCTVSSLSIYLLFIWNEKYYLKYCKCLHHQCEKRKLLQFQENELYIRTTSVTTHTNNTATQTGNTITDTNKMDYTAHVSEPGKLSHETSSNKSDNPDINVKSKSLNNIHFLENNLLSNIGNNPLASKSEANIARNALMKTDFAQFHTK